MAETFYLCVPTVYRWLLPATLSLRIGFKEGNLVKVTVIFAADNMGVQNLTAFPFQILEL